MSTAIENCKGHLHVFSDSGASSGFYTVQPPIPNAGGSKALILGVPLQFAEIVQPTTTLDDKRVLYVFGTAWNEISISGILLLGVAATKGAQVSSLIKWYNTNRVSSLKKPVQVSIGTAGIDAYITGLVLGQANSKTNTQQFTVRMMTADVTP